ncbi:zinc finger protein 319-like [Diorhabda sublineata]|nr:zinc finger protein 319-like [Diorhabda sublineata]
MNAPIKCKICTFIAETPIDLLKHKRDAHKVERKFLPSHEILKYFDYPDRTFCPICEQPIKSRNFRSTFIKHLLIHSAELTYECRICKKKFRRRDHMRSHEKRHVLSYAELKAIEDTVDNSPVQLPVILPT